MNLLPWKRNRESVSDTLLHELTYLRGEMDNVFERFVRGTGLQRLAFGRKGEWYPSTDLKENEKEIIIKCELPGVNIKDIDVSLNRDVLSIKGEKKVENIEDTDDYYLAERGFGSFLRTLQLPDSVDPDSVKAQQRDGVLTITLKKRPGAEQKKVPVEASKN